MLLIGGGALALLDQLGYIEDLSPTLWMFVFAAISLFGFLSFGLEWMEAMGLAVPRGSLWRPGNYDSMAQCWR